MFNFSKKSLLVAASLFGTAEHIFAGPADAAAQTSQIKNSEQQTPVKNETVKETVNIQRKDCKFSDLVSSRHKASDEFLKKPCYCVTVTIADDACEKTQPMLDYALKQYFKKTTTAAPTNKMLGLYNTGKYLMCKTDASIRCRLPCQIRDAVPKHLPDHAQQIMAGEKLFIVREFNYGHKIYWIFSYQQDAFVCMAIGKVSSLEKINTYFADRFTDIIILLQEELPKNSTIPPQQPPKQTLPETIHLQTPAGIQPTQQPMAPNFGPMPYNPYVYSHAHKMAKKAGKARNKINKKMWHHQHDMQKHQWDMQKHAAQYAMANQLYPNNVVVAPQGMTMPNSGVFYYPANPACNPYVNYPTNPVNANAQHPSNNQQKL